MRTAYDARHHTRHDLLIVESDCATRNVLGGFLSGRGYDAQTVTPDEVVPRFEQARPGAVVLNLAGRTALDVLTTLRDIDRRVPFDDPIRAGERVRLTDDVSFAPATGWGLLSGLRTTDVTKSGQKSTGSVEVTEDGVAFFAEQGAWDGTPRQLLDQITKITTTQTGGKGFELSSSPVSIFPI